MKLDIASAENNEWGSFVDSLNEFEFSDVQKNTSPEVDLNLEMELTLSKKEIEVNYHICPECDVDCRIKENIIICEQCGLERKWEEETGAYSQSINQNYNTSNKSYVSFSFIGTNSYCYKRSFLKTCASYSRFRENNNKREIINKIYRYKGSKPPINICNDTASLFNQIKQNGYVYRGKRKWGVIGACLYYSCIKNNLTRTPKEIAKIVNVDDCFLSQGDRTLQELNELGIITIPTSFKPLQDYLDQFFPALKIPNKFKTFIIDLITRAEKKHLHVGNESRMTTKCIGAIHLLCTRIPSLFYIKKDKISRECLKISKSTFVRYYNLLMANGKVLKPTFKRHRIPMPVEWRGL